MTTTTTQGPGVMTGCVVCEEPTTSTVPGSLGQSTGVVCEDCQFWSDGNVQTGSQS